MNERRGSWFWSSGWCDLMASIGPAVEMMRRRVYHRHIHQTSVVSEWSPPPRTSSSQFKWANKVEIICKLQLEEYFQWKYCTTSVTLDLDRVRNDCMSNGSAMMLRSNKMIHYCQQLLHAVWLINDNRWLWVRGCHLNVTIFRRCLCHVMTLSVHGMWITDKECLLFHHFHDHHAHAHRCQS